MVRCQLFPRVLPAYIFKIKDSPHTLWGKKKNENILQHHSKRGTFSFFFYLSFCECGSLKAEITQLENRGASCYF